MTTTRMTFGELVETARNFGFELRDGRELPVNREMQDVLEDENLMSEPARMESRHEDDDQERGVVAVLSVRDQTFHLWGEWSRLWEFERLVAGEVTQQKASPLGRPPGNS